LDELSQLEESAFSKMDSAQRFEMLKYNNALLNHLEASFETKEQTIDNFNQEEK